MPQPLSRRAPRPRMLRPMPRTQHPLLEATQLTLAQPPHAKAAATDRTSRRATREHQRPNQRERHDKASPTTKTLSHDPTTPSGRTGHERTG